MSVSRYCPKRLFLDPGMDRTMQPTVECCISNIDAEARVSLAESDLDVTESFCLDHCGECYESAFLVADGELVRDESHAAVIETLESDR